MLSRLFMVAALLAIGCSSPVEPGPELQPAMITGFFEGDPHISLDVSGNTLLIEVNSYGNGCVSKGEVQVTVDDDTLTVTAAAFDWRVTGNCPDYLATFHHSTTVDLFRAGDWAVHVTGLDSAREPVRFDFTVRVGI